MSNIRLELDLRIASHMHKTNFTVSLEFRKSDNLIGKKHLKSKHKNKNFIK